jgi:hypothetical protein
MVKASRLSLSFVQRTSGGAQSEPHSLRTFKRSRDPGFAMPERRYPTPQGSAAQTVPFGG